jgi:steroid C-25 hydroxylase alpha subunit
MSFDLTRRHFLHSSALGLLSLSLSKLEFRGLAMAAEEAIQEELPYGGWEDLYRRKWTWDKVSPATHYVNCWYQSSCNWNIYVKDGIVWREEQAGIYSQTNGDLPDFNPRGCQKGACFSNRMYDATRLRYPLKRVGERGEGKWKRVSWEEALSEIADTMIDTLTTEGPGAIHTDVGTQYSAGGPHAFGVNRTSYLLDTPVWDMNPDIGDDHQGAAVTCGKIVFCSSADDMFYSDMILIWGGNPIYTQIPNMHFVNEARYKGAKVVSICPDYNPSSIHVDQWVPVRVGTDAALGLALSQVIVAEKLYNASFLKEQTDMPLLVRTDNRLFLREADIKEDGAADVFYAFDLATMTLRAAPRDTLALGTFAPALEGEFEVETRYGKITVRPVFEFLKQRLQEYAPAKASAICGTHPKVIRQLAREIAKARAVTGVTQSNFSKFYHGMEMERAQFLVFALCGHFGKKGSGLQAFPFLSADAVGEGFMYPNLPLPEGKKEFARQLAPVVKALKDNGYTDEMISYELVRGAYERQSFVSSVLTLYLHGGLKDLMRDQRKWDPHMKRDIDEYVKLSLEKKWQYADPKVAPRVMFSEGGNFLRRFRGYPKLIEVFLPKLRLLVDINWRMSNTGRYADFVLPIAGWYERNDLRWVTPLATYIHGQEKAVDPVGESLPEWKLHCLLAKKMQERAQQRGVATFKDRQGKERRLDTIYDDLTYGGNYKEDDDVKLLRDFVKASDNLEGVTWERLAEKGIARFSSIGKAQSNIGNATDLTPTETITPNTWHTDKKIPWPTLTRRMQFYIDHELFLELGEELPVHKEESIGGKYPLRMTGGHTRHSIHTSWRDHALMLRLQRGEPVVYVSVADAKKREIKDHDVVRVFNDVGSFEIRAKISPATVPGQVIVYHAWEPYMFKNGHSHQTVTPSPINPIELAGQYFHLRPMFLSHTPGENDRGVRIEVEKVKGAGAATGLRL